MAHHTSETILSPAELKFMDLMQHGDDFLKIELLRPAKNWYIKALEMNIEPEKVKQKISECDILLAFELKVIRILVVITITLIAAWMVFK